MKRWLLLLVPLLLMPNALQAQCASGSCRAPGGGGGLSPSPTPEQLSRAGYVRIVRPDGSAFWTQPENGVAADAEGRTYRVPVRAAMREGFAGWRAAPRLRPAANPAANPAAAGPATAAGGCSSGNCQASGGCSCQQSGCGGNCQQACDDGNCPMASSPAGPDDVTSLPPIQGERGPKGERGEQGPPGPPGEVDYGKVSDLVASAVNQSVAVSVKQTLVELQPQIENNLLEKMAGDPRFQPIEPDSDAIAQRVLASMASDPRFQPQQPDTAAIVQGVIDRIQQNPELQDLLRGPQGPAGHDGDAGRPGDTYIPPVGTEWSHLVLVVPAKAEYYSRMEPLIRQSLDHYNGLRVIEPPADRNIGPLPVLVAYQGGVAAKTFYGPREVESALVAITRGDYDRFLFHEKES